MPDAAESNRRLLRARDAMDRDFAQPLDVPSLASIACISEANFIRSFKATFGETPHRYLQRRRIERAMYLLRTTDTSVTDVCMQCGFSSLGSFSRTFTDIVGETPSTFRDRGTIPAEVPSCFVRAWTRPSSEVDARTIVAADRTVVDGVSVDGASGDGSGDPRRPAERSSFGEAPTPEPSVP